MLGELGYQLLGVAMAVPGSDHHNTPLPFQGWRPSGSPVGGDPRVLPHSLQLPLYTPLYSPLLGYPVGLNLVILARTLDGPTY